MINSERLSESEKEWYCKYIDSKEFTYVDFCQLYSRVLTIQNKIFRKYIDNSSDGSELTDYKILYAILKWHTSKMPKFTLEH